MNFQPLYLFLHLSAIVVWVGGMFFAYACLRPAAVEVLEPPLRLTLWKRVFDRFLGAVWISIVVLVSSGVAMLWRFGSAMPMHVHLMLLLGALMIAVFINVYFVHYAALRRAVAEQNWPAGGDALGRIRQRVALNIGLGVLTLAAATLGRWV